MLFGLAGSHRSGKTTLARYISETLGIPFYNTSTTEVAKSLGFDPVAPMTLEDRVQLQVALLENHIDQIDRLPRPLITDRTPADYLAYLLCEFSMQSHTQVSELTLARVEQFKELAIEATCNRYDRIFVIGQLPTYAAEPGKPAFNRPFQSHHALLVEGIMSHTKNRISYTRVYNTDLETRQKVLHDQIVARLDQIDVLRRKGSHVN